MGKTLEMRRKKNLDAFNETDEINWKSQQNKTQEELDSIKELFESEFFKKIQEEVRNEDKTSYAILKGIEESEMTDEEFIELWQASDLGKYTINTPVQQKRAIEKQEKHMEPVSEVEFKEISDDVDLEDLELNKRLMAEVQELEGIF